jgi:hypothetical protein
MMAHPWMSLPLSSDVALWKDSTEMTKYVKQRKGGKQNQDDDEDDD